MKPRLLRDLAGVFWWVSGFLVFERGGYLGIGIGGRGGGGGGLEDDGGGLVGKFEKR